jgi:hypothetical protein
MRTRWTAVSCSSFTKSSELKSTVVGWRRLNRCRKSGTVTAAIARSAKGLRNDTGERDKDEGADKDRLLPQERGLRSG